MGTQSDRSSIPMWQRVVCGLFALCGAVAVGLPVSSWVIGQDAVAANVWLAALSAAVGVFLFGFAAVKGRLPTFLSTGRSGVRQS